MHFLAAWSPSHMEPRLGFLTKMDSYDSFVSLAAKVEVRNDKVIRFSVLPLCIFSLDFNSERVRAEYKGSCGKK